MARPILSDLIAGLACTMHAVNAFNHIRGDRRVYRKLCREMADAMDDLYQELHRPEYRGRLVLGPLVILADDEGLLHLQERGGWPRAYRAACGWLTQD